MTTSKPKKRAAKPEENEENEEKEESEASEAHEKPRKRERKINDEDEDAAPTLGDLLPVEFVDG